jgi:hypothetical protein
LISDHVECVIKVIWDQLPLLLICSSLSTISIALFVLLSLFIGFTVDDRFVIVDIENQISSSRWEDRKARKTWGIRREIQVVIFVLGASDLGRDRACA